MKTTKKEAISVARRFNHLYVQVIREQRKANPNRQRIAQWKRDAVKVSARLRVLMAW
jgi:hypothetical protein